MVTRLLLWLRVSFDLPLLPGVPDIANAGSPNEFSIEDPPLKSIRMILLLLSRRAQIVAELHCTLSMHSKWPREPPHDESGHGNRWNLSA